jgi:hypothetical protein
MRMSELVETVSKKPIPPWTKNLLVEVMVNDEDDEDVEVSYIQSSQVGLKLTPRFRMSWFTSRGALERRNVKCRIDFSR